jgi:hypothetical protein
VRYAPIRIVILFFRILQWTKFGCVLVKGGVNVLRACRSINWRLFIKKNMPVMSAAYFDPDEGILNVLFYAVEIFLGRVYIYIIFNSELK